MAQRKKRKSTKKAGFRMNENVIFVSLFFVWLLCSISIYFQAQSAFLGQFVGNFFFKLFGVCAFFFPILFAIWGLALKFCNFEKKLAKNVIYLTAIFLSLLLILAALNNPNGSFKTTMELGAERGMDHRGSGLIGAFLTYFVIRLIGTIGIIVLSGLLYLFFILNLFDVSFKDFLEAIYIKSVFFLKAVMEKWKAHKLRQREKKKKDRIRERDISQNESENKISEEFRSFRFENMDSDEQIFDNFHKNSGEVSDEYMNNKNINNKTSRVFLPFNEYANEMEQDKSDRFQSDNINQHFENQDSRNIKKDVESHQRWRKEPTPPTQEVVLSSSFEEEKMENVRSYPSAADYKIPPLSLLSAPSSSSKSNMKVLKEDAEKIVQTLKSFGIGSEVVGINKGPTVTCFELKPQIGIKVNRIVNLSDDLSLALAAVGIRIEAPIPGKPYIGIEVPNRKKDAVTFREILETAEFKDDKEDLPIALGKGISGEPIISHIQKMPHLLIAGATGAGKSVCINVIIMSLLYKYTPQNLRLILIDPKVVELSVYEGIPHLLIPVVTDAKKASKALYMAVQEMERRYRLFSEQSVRDIYGYREKSRMDETLENLPFLVIIVDELSDLMMVASKDVESHITRLAQMARACGIHLIIATQRPSVDVITGTIKANIPSRFSFQVSSSIDSRTILDMNGAEKLLGKGDMLYYPGNYPKPVRVQCAFISDREVSNIVDYIKKNSQENYDEDFVSSIENKESNPNVDGNDFADSLMTDVIDYLRNEETTSISALQRRFRIGYARAGRIIDDLESIGYVSSQEGSKPRRVTIPQYEADLGENEDEFGE